MYKKFLIIASKADKAAINISSQMQQFRKNPVLSGMNNEKGFDFYLLDALPLYSENLDMEKISKYDFVIFVSKHSSAKGERAITVHTPGNFGEAKFGGEIGKICPTSAVFQKQLFENLRKNIESHDLRGYALTMEATHHGPLIDKPCIFVEIGSTDAEYGDRRAGFIVAKTISETIDNFRENPYNEVAIAIGGPHYCPNFNKLQMKSNLAIAHVIPQYLFPLTEEMINEAIEKTEEEVDFLVVDWKGMGRAEDRDEAIRIIEKSYIQWRKTTDIGKN